MRHRVLGVDRQIQHHLFDLPGVALNHSQMRRQADFDGDIFAQHPPQHAVEFGNHQIQADRLHGDGLLAREDQQAMHQIARSLGRLNDFEGIAALLRIVRQLLGQHFSIAQNRRKHVVQIMGHSARQLAHRLQFARLLQFILQALALGFSSLAFADVRQA
ncbi:MAG: hypothetical protein BWZ10_02853 [candidate division BRC1 bacterium ADurb.BinA364]|nr:MAG: hypothetical protein BWZ10_02853 [candidate division BRC1 bacterium ADurb.BinA364]